MRRLEQLLKLQAWAYQRWLRRRDNVDWKYRYGLQPSSEEVWNARLAFFLWRDLGKQLEEQYPVYIYPLPQVSRSWTLREYDTEYLTRLVEAIQ